VSSGAGTAEKLRSEVDHFHVKKVEARTAIIAEFRCDIHSLPDRPMACWKDPASQECYPITESNLNFWAMQIVSNLPLLFSKLIALRRPRNPISTLRTRN